MYVDKKMFPSKFELIINYKIIKNCNRMDLNVNDFIILNFEYN